MSNKNLAQGTHRNKTMDVFYIGGSNLCRKDLSNLAHGHEALTGKSGGSSCESGEKNPSNSGQVLIAASLWPKWSHSDPQPEKAVYHRYKGIQLIFTSSSHLGAWDFSFYIN